MPLAISPAMYGNRAPWASVKLRSPSHSGYVGGTIAATFSAPAVAASTGSPPAATPCRPVSGSTTTNAVSRTRCVIWATSAGVKAGASDPLQPPSGGAPAVAITGRSPCAFGRHAPQAAAGRIRYGCHKLFARRVGRDDRVQQAKLERARCRDVAGAVTLRQAIAQALVFFSGELVAVQDPHRGLGRHDADLGTRPRHRRVGAEVLRVHADVGAAKRLAQNHGYAPDARLSE